MPQSNPVRGLYMLQGLDFLRAGVLRGKFIREDTKAALHSDVPAMERWTTSHLMVRAAALAGADGLTFNMAAIPANVILPYLQRDKDFKIWQTEEFIVKMLGGDSPEHRAFAQAELAKLNTAYGVAATKAA